jgi:apolipoprotein N-acyltransferase
MSRGAALRLLAAPVSGALLAAAFPALDLGPLALVALVPLLLATRPSGRARRPPSATWPG